MLSHEMLKANRRITPSERLALTLETNRESIPYLLMGPPDVVDRRFELIRRGNDARNRAMLEKLRAAYGMTDEKPAEETTRADI